MTFRQSFLYALDVMGYSLLSAIPVILYGIFLVWLFRKNLRR
jgi:hypothetical protein